MPDRAGAGYLGPDTLPEWAAEWLPGTCNCGARLVRPDCICGGHVVCSATAWVIEKCPNVEPPVEVIDYMDREGDRHVL